MNILVLGAGLVGAPMALDLAKEPSFRVTSADISQDALDRVASSGTVAIRQCDFGDRQVLSTLIAQFDLIVSAVPGFLGFETLRTIIDAGKNVVDISFFPEDPYLLEEQARTKNVTALVDFGLCPGTDGLLVGHAAAMLDTVEEVLIYVGGLPQVRQWPFEYKAVFSPIDVIEEYTRPARLVEHGVEIVRPALSDPELITLPGIGTLEAFNTDGLRTLLRNIRARSMKEKTLRYPGHAALMKTLREVGFFSKDPVNVHGAPVKPVDLTAALLFPQWKMQKGEGDVTVMRVIVAGAKNGAHKAIQYDMNDRWDQATETLSMARTTGYAATAAVRMLSKGLFNDRGIIAPEIVGRRPSCVEFILGELAKRGVVYERSES